MPRHSRHSHLPKVRIVLFLVFVIVLFLFIRFFATYPSDTGVREYKSGPTQAPRQPNILPTGDPGDDAVTKSAADTRTEPLATFSRPDEALVFDYPAGWTLSAGPSGTWLVSDTAATESAAIRIEISKRSSLPACGPKAESCRDIILNNRPFRIESGTLNTGLAFRVYSTLHQGTAYVFTGTFRGGSQAADSIMSEIGGSITFQ
ncbi:MAG: hypothetical protein N2691_02205 [Patescibacteria group bacterium]|nr:hypothetical protein [Patescibacteria group bacterium]